MNAPRLTDAQISRALRAHVPERAQAGLRERVLVAAGTTTRQRAMPSFLGALSDADPIAQRRMVLIAAALLVALAFASAAAVGALRLLQRDAITELSIEPPADVQAFVLSSYDRLPELPPLAMTRIDNGSVKSRMYVDRSGAVRFERFASADATKPETYRILSGMSVGSLETVGSEKVWVVNPEAIGEDPRGYIHSGLGLGGITFDRLPGCELTRDPDEAGSGTAATGWRYVGVESVAGRPAHQFTCGGGDLWLDVETRLILRARAPLVDDADQPIPGQFQTIEVTEITFGEQPAALFDLTAPVGVASVPIEELEAYRCARDPICSATPPSARPEQTQETNLRAPGSGPSANP